MKGVSMHRCHQAHADVIIDGWQYRLDSLTELRSFVKHQKLKGITLTNLEKTTSRLVAAHKVSLLARRRAKHQIKKDVALNGLQSRQQTM